MNQQQIFELYEKLYFHEVEAKEKIAARLQLPLAITISFTSIYAILLKGLNLDKFSGWNIIFILTLVLSGFLFIKSSIYFIKAFYGHTYEMIPTAADSEKYRKLLINTYEDYENAESLVEQYFQTYLFERYSDCSTNNSKVNDKRSELLHKCNTFFVLNIIPLSSAFLIFTLAGIDKSAIDKHQKVSIENPVSIQVPTANICVLAQELEQMTKAKPTAPPPPPPPPPKRQIKEDLNIPNKPSQPQKGE